MRSRCGFSAIRASSSPTSSVWRPSARSASTRSSTAARRSSSSRPISSLGERLEGKLGQRRAAPERQCVVQGARGAPGSPRANSSRPSASSRSKRRRSSSSRPELEHVAGRARQQRPGREQLAQPRHVDVQGLHRRLGRLLAPELVDQPVAGEHLVRVHEQQRQQRALLRARERQRPVAVANLQRSQDPELHCPTLLQAPV